MFIGLYRLMNDFARSKNESRIGVIRYLECGRVVWSTRLSQFPNMFNTFQKPALEDSLALDTCWTGLGHLLMRNTCRCFSQTEDI